MARGPSNSLFGGLTYLGASTFITRPSLDRTLYYSGSLNIYIYRHLLNPTKTLQALPGTSQLPPKASKSPIRFFFIQSLRAFRRAEMFFRSFSFWDHLRPCWAILGLCWAILGASWAILGSPWAILGPSWAILGPFRAILGGGLRKILEVLEGLGGS